MSCVYSSDEEKDDNGSQDERQGEQETDDEFEVPGWFTELEKSKEKFTSCYFLAKQVARMEHELKAELEKKQQKSKVSMFKMLE